MCLVLGTFSAFADAQTRPQLPDENVQTRLIWATMIAVDNANRTDNYSVLRSLGSPEFQARYPEAVLRQNLSGLRERRVDVGRAILTKPDFYLPPQITPEGYLRLRGAFEYRPQSIRFDTLYKLHQGGWRLHGLSIAEMDFDAPR